MSKAEINARQVKELRERTGAGMMDCKRALEESGGDAEEAVRILWEKGLASVKKRQERTAGQGVVESYIHIGRQIGALVEINCETDFVARNEEFLALAHEVALQVAACNPQYLDRSSVPPEVLEVERNECLFRCSTDGGTGQATDHTVEEMLEKYYQEVCLLEQPYVKDPSLSIADLLARASARLGEKLEISRFSRFQVGEKGEGG